jgi:hypothetical protein
VPFLLEPIRKTLGAQDLRKAALRRACAGAPRGRPVAVGTVRLPARGLLRRREDFRRGRRGGAMRDTQVGSRRRRDRRPPAPARIHGLQATGAFPSGERRSPRGRSKQRGRRRRRGPAPGEVGGEDLPVYAYIEGRRGEFCWQFRLFVAAAASGDLTIVRAALEDKRNPLWSEVGSIAERIATSALVGAAAKGSVELVRWLQENGVELAEDRICAMFSAACMEGRLAVVLLQNAPGHASRWDDTGRGRRAGRDAAAPGAARRAGRVRFRRSPAAGRVGRGRYDAGKHAVGPRARRPVGILRPHLARPAARRRPGSDGGPGVAP